MPRSANPGSATFDVALAAASGVLSLSFAAAFLDGRNAVPAVALVVAHSTALAVRRRAPWVAMAGSIASALALGVVGMPTVVLHVSPLVVLYTLASLRRRRESALGLVAAVAVMLAVLLLQDSGQELSTVVGNVVALSGAWLLGTFVLSRQAYVEALEARTRELSAARDELAHAAVVEERLRLARELHDVVAHSLSMISVQAGAGAHVLDESPEQARASLDAIAAASREALTEMRRMLGLLRDEGAALAPAPGIERIPALAEDVSRSGPRVRVQVYGDPVPLPAGVDLAAYRIAQESLTNVVRHAAATEARVVVVYEPGSVSVEVVDDGRGAARAATTHGRGLAGMEERVLMLGGHLESGTLPEGGFRVHAVLPLAVTA